MKLLLDSGADVRHCKHDGATPLHIAAEKGNVVCRMGITQRRS
jgi:ankyrin repeat protein